MLNIDKYRYNREKFVICAKSGSNEHEHNIYSSEVWICLPSHIAKTGLVFKTGNGVFGTHKKTDKY